MSKVVSFGEIMLRLSPEGMKRFVQTENFQGEYEGGEANAAVSLANFGMDVRFVTKLPGHAIGQCAVNALRRYGIDTSCIVRGGDAIGIYFLEKKAGHRPAVVIYQRAGSAFAKSEPWEYDWNRIFDGASWFHFSGITPALSPDLASICLAACQEAKKRGITVSCDLNYRSKLWDGATANRVMSEICPYVDVCIANEDDAIGIFQMDTSNQERPQEYVAKALTDRFHFKAVASAWRDVTDMKDDACGTPSPAGMAPAMATGGFYTMQAMLYTGGKTYYGRKYFMAPSDYIGCGDAFCAGLIYAMMNDYTPQRAVEFGDAASCFKHTVSGDSNLASVDEIRALAFAGDSSDVSR